MLITKSKTVKSGVRKRTVNRVVRIGPLSLRFITLIMFAALALLYLAQSTQSATKTYTTQELKIQKDELFKEKERLDIEATRLKSLQQIQNDVSRLGLEQKQ